MAVTGTKPGAEPPCAALAMPTAVVEALLAAVFQRIEWVAITEAAVGEGEVACTVPIAVSVSPRTRLERLAQRIDSFVALPTSEPFPPGLARAAPVSGGTFTARPVFFTSTPLHA